jgi:S-adenosylmethionine:tRNA ribosyltransferase-isomerase
LEEIEEGFGKLMKLADFDYHLPEGLIAQEPCRERDKSRMMVIHRNTGSIEHRYFYELPDFLREGDALVVNDSKVIPARLTGTKETGAAIEMLLLSKVSGITPFSQTWEAMLKPAKRVRTGTTISFSSICQAKIIGRISERKWLIAFDTGVPFGKFLEKYGKAPLPPYIKRNSGASKAVDDIERYQTIYATRPGSIAAPTAGLHFSSRTMERLRSARVDIASVTLHVGYGTFIPIETDDIEDHVMEEESYEIGEESAKIINGANRVIAVGTTTTRALETAADENGFIKSISSLTRLFIYPGYRFRRVDALLTNLHLPKSSLFLLVCAFAGIPLIRKAYAQAMEKRCRFYSYGDCMLIL